MKPLLVAKVLRPQGLRGEIKLRPYLKDILSFLSISSIFIKMGESFMPYDVCSSRVYKTFVYLKLTGCDCIEHAELLRNKDVYVKRTEIEMPPVGEHFIVDLEGLQIIDDEGNELGYLDQILDTGGVPIYCVKGGNDFMFPALAHVIIDTNFEKRYIKLNTQKLAEVVVYD